MSVEESWRGCMHSDCMSAQHNQMWHKKYKIKKFFLDIYWCFSFFFGSRWPNAMLLGAASPGLNPTRLSLPPLSCHPSLHLSNKANKEIQCITWVKIIFNCWGWTRFWQIKDSYISTKIKEKKSCHVTHGLSSTQTMFVSVSWYITNFLRFPIIQVTSNNPKPTEL